VGVQALKQRVESLEVKGGEGLELGKPFVLLEKPSSA
jgi:hypothetical protein